MSWLLRNYCHYLFAFQRRLWGITPSGVMVEVKMSNRAKLVILIIYTACFITVWKMNPHFSFENLQENEEDVEHSTEFIKWAKIIKSNKCCSCATCEEHSGLFMEQHFLSDNLFLSPEYNFTQEDFAWWKALQREAGSLANFKEAKDRFFAVFPSKPNVSEPSPDCCLTCAVVGNSRNLCGSKYGSQIDANDIIIRMNTAVIAGFEEDVGTKTTHRVLYPESAIDLDNNTHLVLFPYKILDLQWITEAFTTGFRGRSYAPVKSKIKGNKDLVMVVSPAFMKYVHTSWLSNKGHYPSTGFMTLVLAMHMCDEVKVFGFGADRNGDWSHYWEVLKVKNLKSGQHPGKQEYDLIQELAKQKKVTFFRGW